MRNLDASTPTAHSTLLWNRERLRLQTLLYQNYDMIWYDIWYDIFVNCNWVDTRWQWYSTHLHINNTYNNTINNKTNNKQNNINLEEYWPCPVFCEFYPDICLTTEGKARKNISQGSRRDSKYTHYQDTHTHKHYKTHTHPHITKQFKTITVQIKTNTVQDIPKWNRFTIQSSSLSTSSP
jgi:hypothetical protein